MFEEPPLRAQEQVLHFDSASAEGVLQALREQCAAFEAACLPALAADIARKVVTVNQRPEGFLHLGRLLVESGLNSEACSVYEEGLARFPFRHDDAELQANYNSCAKISNAESSRRTAEVFASQRRVCRALQAARHDEACQHLVAQWQQSMSAPEWDLNDFGWRPTFVPRMRESQTSRQDFCASPWNSLYLSYAELIGELEQPKRALAVLRDEIRMQAYKRAIEKYVRGKRVAVLESGGGVLPLLCATAGATSVTAVERSPMLARMAMQTIEANDGKCNEAGIDVVTVASLEERKFDSSANAEVLITDLFDHTLLGMRLANSMQKLLKCGLVRPGVAVFPCRAVLWASLSDIRLTDVCGFDLRAMNTYRWHSSAEKFDSSRCMHRELSQKFACCDIDLTTFLGDCSPTCYDLNVAVTLGGVWNAVVVWYELDFGDIKISSSECSSIQRAIYFFDERHVRSGDKVDLKCVIDGGQLIFQTSAPQHRPHHALVPSWHFDMLSDEVRNVSYNKAIAAAVARIKTCHNTNKVTVLDVGTGSGILGMMAARAGSDTVVGLELSSHMCSVADETLARNGLLDRVTVLNRDARHVYALDSEGLRFGRKPDGLIPELNTKANIMVFEVFDSGLIGEGALHLLHAARTRLLTADAQIIPAAATVFCQLVEWRLTTVQGINVEPLNKYHWRPDYEGVDLANVRDQWRALSEPAVAFAFNFYDVVGSSANRISVAASASGTVNAVVMWFELFLDENNVLSTNPHVRGKGPTWQQAVQFVPETNVREGEQVTFEAVHDSYSICFKMSASPQREWCDPTWMSTHDRLAEINKRLMKNIVQSPVEHRRAALAATQMAARPVDLDLDADVGVQLFRRMYA